MHHELSLGLYLLVVDAGALSFSHRVPDLHQEIDEDNDGAEGSAHFVCHVVIVELEVLDLVALLVVRFI